MEFEITEDDIANVLRQHSHKVVDSDGKDFATMAAEIHSDFDSADFDRVADAALASGTEMDEQTNGAYDEIYAILVEKGVVKSPHPRPSAA